ncbi:MAG: hypothetical protein NEHIOOID_00868 [Holosporales bacterium]
MALKRQRFILFLKQQPEWLLFRENFDLKIVR